MNFIVDIGNSNTVIGLYKDDILIKRCRIATDRNLTVDDISSKIHSLMMFSKIEISDIAFCIIISVVPTWNHIWERFAIEFLDFSFQVILSIIGPRFQFADFSFK